jgi:hypothetical protein
MQLVPMELTSLAGWDRPPCHRCLGVSVGSTWCCQLLCVGACGACAAVVTWSGAWYHASSWRCTVGGALPCHVAYSCTQGIVAMPCWTTHGHGTTEQLVHGGWCHAVVDASQMHTVPMKWCCARARIATSRTEHLPIKDGRVHLSLLLRAWGLRDNPERVCVQFVVRCVGSAMHQHNGVAPHHHACSRAWIAWHVDGRPLHLHWWMCPPFGHM